MGALLDQPPVRGGEREDQVHENFLRRAKSRFAHEQEVCLFRAVDQLNVASQR